MDKQLANYSICHLDERQDLVMKILMDFDISTENYQLFASNLKCEGYLLVYLNNIYVLQQKKILIGYLLLKIVFDVFEILHQLD